MSYVLNVYSPNDQPVTVEELKSHVESQGWTVTFVSQGHVSQQKVLNPQGLLQDNVLMYRWKAHDEDATSFSRLMQEGDFTALWEFPSTLMKIAICGVSFSATFDINQEWDEDEITELEEFDEEYVAHLRKAKSVYAIQAGKSSGSIEFTHDVWNIIGNLVGGLLDDAHEGTYKFITAP